MFRNKNTQIVVCGKQHTLFLVDGQVWGTGYNKDGQVGNGTSQSVFKPVLLRNLNKVFTISAWHSSAALTQQGDCYLWGSNNCLLPTKIQNKTFTNVKIGGNLTLFTDQQGRILQSQNGDLP